MKVNKKKTIIISSIIILLIGLICIFLFMNRKIIITLDTNGGNKIDSITIKSNSSINLPKPYKEHYSFNAWYADNKKVNSKYKFTKDTKLVAKWTKEKYTITFCIETSENCPQKEIVNYQDKVKEPASPNKEGYQFLGWYFNDTKYNFDLPVEKDMIILAKLEKVVASETSNDEHGYYCRSGYKLNKDKCTKTYSIRATLQHICPEGSEYEGKGICFETSTETTADQVACGEGEITQNTGSVIRCYYDETELDESECSKNSWYFYNGVCYSSYRRPSCKNGKSTTIGYRFEKEVYYCGGKHSMAKAAYTCPPGYNLNNTMCYKTETINANYK